MTMKMSGQWRAKENIRGYNCNNMQSMTMSSLVASNIFCLLSALTITCLMVTAKGNLHNLTSSLINNYQANNRIIIVKTLTNGQDVHTTTRASIAIGAAEASKSQVNYSEGN